MESRASPCTASAGDMAADTSTSMTKRVEGLLTATRGSLAVDEMAHMCGADRGVVTNAIIRVREKYGHRLKKTTKKYGGVIVTAYRIDQVGDPQAVPAPETAFGINLWRGWCNPITGVCGERLGLS